MAGPAQLSTATGTLNGAVDGSNRRYSSALAIAQSLVFWNGLLQTQPTDVSDPTTGQTTRNAALLVTPPNNTNGIPDVVTFAAWVLPSLLALNLPVQLSTVDGTVAGAINGHNNVFTLVTTELVTDFLFAWNGVMLTQGIDYTWTTNQPSSAGGWVTTITMLGGQIPNADDILTVQVFGA